MATITSLLRDRVSLRIRCVDRIFLQAHVPGLMTMYQVIRFLLYRGFPIPSPAALGKIGDTYVKSIERFIADGDLPYIRFQRKQNKEETARPYFAKAAQEGRFGVVLVVPLIRPGKSRPPRWYSTGMAR